MDGPPKDVPGQCNARLFVGDDYGDNTATFRCPLPEGHDGEHVERFSQRNEADPDKPSGMVTVTWHYDDRMTCPKHGLQPGDWCRKCHEERRAQRRQQK
jgi:hypothetical protein